MKKPTKTRSTPTQLSTDRLATVCGGFIKEDELKNKPLSLQQIQQTLN